MARARGFGGRGISCLNGSSEGEAANGSQPLILPWD